jgi:hypothetical protein
MNLDQFTKELEKHGEADAVFDAARFEIDCIKLLGRCDHQLQQLEKVKERDRIVHVLIVGRTVLAEIAEFLIGQIGADFVSHELPRIREPRDDLKQRINELKPATLMSKRGFGSRNEIERTELNDIGSQLLTLCDDLLMSIDEHYTDDSRAARWATSRSVFIKEFQSVW